MGTFYTHGATKKDIIAELLQSSPQRTTVKHSLRGNVLWTIEDCKVPGYEGLMIGCYLIRCSDGEWGYKPLSEACGPFYYDCPLGYLDLVPEKNPDWRAKVRAFHAEKREKAKAKASREKLRKEFLGKSESEKLDIIAMTFPGLFS